MSFEPPEKWVFDHGTIDLQGRRVVRTDGGGPVPLTVREVDLLRYLAQAQGRLVGRDELLREVWGPAADVEPRLVDSAVRRLRAKIERDPTDARILTEAWGEGYKLALPAPPQTTAPSAAVPRPRTPLVGREPVMHRVAEELARTGFVVLVGPPGVGKTRIALELAHRTEPASFVPLAGVRTVDEVRHVVASALGVRAAAEEELEEELLGVLAGRLLVLDDLTAHDGGDLVARWLGAPGLRILATRPEPFGVPEEVAVRIAPLDRPAAAALYTIRAEAAGRRPGAEEHRQVDALVDRLEGIPLAIELAAAWAPLLDPAAVRDAIDEAAVSARPLDPLDAAVRCAWRMVTREDQDVLLGCSVFPGVFDPTWVSSVAEAPARVPGSLPTLRRRGLLVAAGKRLQVPPAVRSFLVAERRRKGDDALVERFAAWCAEEGARLGEAFVDASAPRELMIELATVVASVHAVHDPDRLARAALALGPALDAAGWYGVHLAQLDRAIGAEPSPALLGRLEERRAAVLLAVGDVEAAERAIGRAEAAGADDPVLRAAIALDRAGVAGFRGAGERVLSLTRHAAEVLRTKVGLDPQRAGALWLLIGANLLAARDRAGTEAAYLEAVACAQAIGSHRRAAAAFTRLASLAIDDDDVGLASARVGQAESELRVVGLRANAALLRVRGALAELRGDHPLAEVEWREVAKVAGARGEAWIEHEARLALARVAIRRGAVDEARELLDEAAAFARGRWTAGWVEAAALIGRIAAPAEAERIREELLAAGAAEAAAFVRGEGRCPDGATLTTRLRWAVRRA